MGKKGSQGKDLPNEASSKDTKEEDYAHELLDILTEIEGKPLDLAVVAALKEASSRKNGFGGAAYTRGKEDPNEEVLLMHLDSLFTKHVGKSPQIIIDNALRTSKEELNLEEYILHKLRTHGSTRGDERQQYWNHPDNRSIRGPKPDGKVWLALLLGQKRADKILKSGNHAPMKTFECGGMFDDVYDSDQESIEDPESTEEIVYKSLHEAQQLSLFDLMYNILKYVRMLVDEEDTENMACMLRFSALYGLDGVMKDILEDRYGDADNLDENSLIALHDNDYESDRVFPYAIPPTRMYWPVYALGAIAGHKNIVTVALNELGGDIDLEYGYQSYLQEPCSIYDHRLPSEIFHWVFQKNLLDMVECLVKECGFQFRWIDHKEYVLGTMFETIFEVQNYPKPPWDGVVEEDDFLSERELERKASYASKMKMLDLLISLGFPFELFFPTEPTCEYVEKQQKAGKLLSREEIKDYQWSLTRDQEKANERLYNACSSYNKVQTSKAERLSANDFYKKLKARWEEGQEIAQISKLEEYEALDSRWREWKIRKQRKKRRQDGEESESDDEDSDDDSDLEE